MKKIHVPVPRQFLIFWWHFTVYSSAYDVAITPTIGATAVTLASGRVLGCQAAEANLGSFKQKKEKGREGKEKLTSWDLERTLTGQLQGHRKQEPGL